MGAQYSGVRGQVHWSGGGGVTLLPGAESFCVFNNAIPTFRCIKILSYLCSRRINKFCSRLVNF